MEENRDNQGRAKTLVLLNQTQAAKVLGIDRKTLGRLSRPGGRLDFLRLPLKGKQPIYALSLLEELIELQKKKLRRQVGEMGLRR